MTSLRTPKQTLRVVCGIIVTVLNVTMVSESHGADQTLGKPVPSTVKNDNAEYPYPLPLPKSGECSSEFVAVEDRVVELMLKWNVPGAAVAIYRDGEIVYSRGIGWADVNGAVPVAPESLFRIGSISKTLTAAAILRLAELRKLSLDQPILPLLKSSPGAYAEVDSRFSAVTARQLLKHTSGIREDSKDDPLLRKTCLAMRHNFTPRRAPTPMELAQFGLQKAPAYFVGSRFSYSNLGYVILGRVIESASGATYENFVLREVLIPCGVTKMRLGHSRSEQRAENEVAYYDYPRAEHVIGVEDSKPTVWPYGGFSLDALDAACGWIGNVNDATKFMLHFTQENGETAILAEEFRRELLNTDPLTKDMDGTHYSLGLRVQTTATGPIFWHSGAMPGTISLVCSDRDGNAFGIVMNSRPLAWSGCISELREIFPL